MDDIQETVQEVNTNKSSSFNPLLIVGIIAVVAIGGAVIFMGQGKNTATDSMKKEETTTVPTTTQVDGTSDATSPAMTDEQTITLEAGAFYYKPNVITAKKGQKIKVVMTSKDMMHDFIIDELGVKLPITKSGETNTVEFTPDKTGTFEFYCSVGQHRAKGQVGKITFSE